jgi:hypothetical protein
MNDLNFPAAPAGTSGDDNEFSQIDLASGYRPSQDESLASTLYDPSVLTLDPKVRAQMAADADEKARKATLGIVEENAALGIALSPKSPVPGKNPFEADEESGAVLNESPLCCCGLLPLRAVVLTVNGLDVVVGIVALAVGIAQLAKGAKKTTEGFGTVDSMLLSGPYMVNTACCVGGAFLIAVGLLGILLANELTFGRADRTRKVLFLVYQSLLLLVILVFFILVVLTAVALGTLRGKNIYDDSHWRGIIQKEPVCQTEVRFKCAGFQNNECLLAFSTVADTRQNCPGHFCYDFCQVRETIQNPNPACAVCPPGYDWLACKEHEERVGEGNGCSAPVNANISNLYAGGIWVLALVCVASIATMCVAAFRSCCLAPLPE